MSLSTVGNVAEETLLTTSLTFSIQGALVKRQWDHHENLSIISKNKHLQSQTLYCYFTPSTALIPLLNRLLWFPW